MLEFRSTIKGATSETLIRALLQSAGYTVIPTSVEQLIPSVVTLTQARYAQPALPKTLRHMGDLLVIPPAGAARLLEIKYRTRVDRAGLTWLREKALKQQSIVPEAQVVLIRGISPAGGKATLDDIVRVVPPGRGDLFTAAELMFQQPLEGVSEATRAEGFWRSLQPLPELLPALREHPEEVETVVRTFLALARM